jgi:23S rRNA maturation mini-RNase III
MVNLYEKLGLFYLGRDVDKNSQEATDALTLLKNKNFTTHATIIGMTGSGKTGLGIGIIEEASIDNIPAIVIDPKGDMGNLLLTDPEFSSDSFEPWVRDEANTKGVDSKEYAKKIATIWQEGIKRDHQDKERVARLTAVEKSIYTPGSSTGLSINILGSLEAPPREIIEDTDAFSSYLKSSVSSLLSLIGIEADPVSSKEYLLIAQLLADSWMRGRDISLEALIGAVINPPFDKIGVLPLESFYPQDKRFALATKFNAIIASPTFSSWLQGEPLDIQKLLYDKDGKAKISIFSIAHLSDDERMFFVTLLLNRYIAWMRRQSGTSALKTLLYMDEIFGFFPPSKNPPSKEPMLLLLKQARAFGVGVVLSTQNPVDLDYKGLSNIGTWFIGRLQTSQDIDRVIDGLGGKIGGSYSKSEIKSLLTNLNKRTFFLKSAHLDDIRLFTTRWVMSYLKGPLKGNDISKLMKSKKSNIEPQSVVSKSNKQNSKYREFVTLDSSIEQLFSLDVTGTNSFRATLQGEVELHYYNQSKEIDENETLYMSLELYEDEECNWDDAIEKSEWGTFSKSKPSSASFAHINQKLESDRGLNGTKKELKEWLYRNKRLTLFRSRSPRLSSKPYESIGEFKVRVKDILDDKKEQEIEKLQNRYEKKEQILLKRLKRAKERVTKEEADATKSMVDTGIAILGALFGRSSSAKLGRVLSKGSHAYKERADINRAEEQVEAIEEEIEELSYELEDKISDLALQYDVDNVEITESSLKLRKSDIKINRLSIVWVV